MLTVGIFPNLKKTGVDGVVDRLIKQLRENNTQFLLPEEAARELGYPAFARDGDRLREEIQLGLTIGGDGTIINVARDVAPAGVPVCGINMGQLGFLTEIEPHELETAVKKLLDGDYRIEERIMLDAFVRRGAEEIFISSAVNDVVVSKGGFARIIRLNLYIDGELAAKYPGDGLIVATSTGSTGYSLAAGGPIINPSLKVITVTPICPHTLHSRSLVVSEKEEIMIAVQATHDDIVVTVDGQTLYNPRPDDALIVRRAPFRARFARMNGRSFANVLNTKLWRGETDAGR